MSLSLRKSSKSKSKKYDFTNFTESKGKQMESILNNLTNKYQLSSREKREKEIEEQKEAEKEKIEKRRNKETMKTYNNRQGINMQKGFVGKSLKKISKFVGIGGKSENKKTNNNKKTRKNKKQ